MQLTINSPGNVINFQLKEKEITQNELAQKLNVTQGAISQAIHDYEHKYTTSELRKRIITYVNNKKKKGS